MLFRFLALALISASIVYWFNVRMTPEDIIAYEKLSQESTELRRRKALQEQPAHQKRHGVQKDIWSQNETRHFTIQSEHSELTLSQKKDKMEIIEELENIQCHIKDGFTLTADEGIYTFPSHQFIAQTNCHLTQDQNKIDGTKITLDLDKEIVTYENPKGHLSQGSLDFTAKTLVWHKKIGKLYLTDQVTITQPEQFTLVADQGTLTLDEFQPSLLVLEGNVQLISSRIQDKISHALADTLTYNPTDKTLLFSAAKKVLFWQDGLHLSAEEVLIRENQTVEGKGDVHFTFDLEEQNYIDKFFKQYL